MKSKIQTDNIYEFFKVDEKHDSEDLNAKFPLLTKIKYISNYHKCR